ncbi:helix-turn-helix transcriptional regulator [Chachezhania sediminis]|uniref:helix-turn-helix transcriptional regulator n=1 Tax=Chachezhania sediminis TaxID=2599291 RepID=UPI001E34B22C|nr:AraC family transcriptional regulator [Chachezhania sediminis]
MAEVAIVRAAHLQVYIDELREIGVPVEKAWARSRLPGKALEEPDTYVSFAHCLEWLGSCSRDVELMEFGFRSARRESLASLGAPVHRAILAAPTGIARLQALTRYAALEDNVLSLRMQAEGDRIRVISTMAGFTADPSIAIGEWIDLHALISIIRSVAGPRWCPKEMTFVSRHRLPPAVQEAFPNTHFRMGQPCTSILVDGDVLARRGVSCGGDVAARSVLAADTLPEEDPFRWNTVAALRAVIRPYLADGYPSLPQMAETFRMSERTLQRRIRECGQSYSEIVQDARFDLAREMLVDRSVRIIDIAMAVGYENPQHFARAFRRHSGVSPTLFRKSLPATG